MELPQQLATCQKCNLCHSRTNVVLGDGNPRANVLFIGESPTRDEDLHGKSCVGRPGALLKLTLTDKGFPVDDAFFTNVVRCRSDGEVSPASLAQCRQWTTALLRQIRPKVIVTLGRTATQEAASILGIEDLLNPRLLSVVGRPWAARRPKGVYQYPITHPIYALNTGETEWFGVQVEGLVDLYREVVAR